MEAEVKEAEESPRESLDPEEESHGVGAAVVATTTGASVAASLAEIGPLFAFASGPSVGSKATIEPIAAAPAAAPMPIPTLSAEKYHP